MRKEKGFEVADKINLYVAGNEMLENIIKKYADNIKKDTLTVDIVYNSSDVEYTETTINGEKLNINVVVVK